MPAPETLYNLSEYQDITAELSDLNTEDTVYRTPSGRTVKVKARRGASPLFGVQVIQLSGSDCDENGKALVEGEGYRIGPPRPLTLQADNPGAIAQALEDEKRRVADQIERAAMVHEMNLPGVG